MQRLIVELHRADPRRSNKSIATEVREVLGSDTTDESVRWVLGQWRRGGLAGIREETTGPSPVYEAVRQASLERPDATAAELADRVSELAMRPISPDYVSLVRARLRKEGLLPRPERKPPRRPAATGKRPRHGNELNPRKPRWPDDGGKRREPVVGLFGRVVAHSGWTTCLGPGDCDRRFFSWDVRSIRLCERCRPRVVEDAWTG